ncbi:MAG: sulfite reductase subunit alpha [Opitutaceae bacterium]
MPDPDEPAGYNKDNPFSATLTVNRILNKPGSAKDTRHLVVNVAGSGFRYKTGDSLGVFPSNHPEVVDGVLKQGGFSGQEPVALPKVEGLLPLREALSSRLSLAQPTRKFLEFFMTRTSDPSEKARLEELLSGEKAEACREYLLNREVPDLLEDFPGVRLSAQDLVDLLRRLNPRLYSIASSFLAYPEEIHLTVAPVRYTTNNRERHGVCSTFLADRARPGIDQFPVFLSSSHFGLTEDKARDIIMVGPGTGIAPFRAFLQEREATGASGRNWLFFGDQHAATDYLYGEEFEDYVRKGILHRVDLAFSRDQDHKIYVQDRLRESGPEIWKWIRDGAIFYVCGDAKRMAKDVDTALRDIFMQAGGMSEDQAAEAIKLMRREKRYQRDVY